MIRQHNPSSTSYFEPATFLAILVTGIILISIAHPDPTVVKALTDLVAAYVVAKYAARQRHLDGGREPRR